MMITTDLLPGDVLAVRTTTFFSWWIRLGAWLRRQDSGHDHIVIVYGRDAQGVLQGIEGRPGGVGWIDIEREYDARWFVANVRQPRTQEQRDFITSHAKLLLGTQYDWEAIVADGGNIFSPTMVAAAQTLIQRWSALRHGADFDEKKTPSHVVCSSFAVWLHHHAPAYPETFITLSPAGLATSIYAGTRLLYPDQHGERWTTPADWVDWIRLARWELTPPSS